MPLYVVQTKIPIGGKIAGSGFYVLIDGRNKAAALTP